MSNGKRRRAEKARRSISLSLPDKKALQFILDGHRALNYIKQQQGHPPISLGDYLFFALMQNSEALIKMANQLSKETADERTSLQE